MARQINYIKKNHVTCQIYTLFSPTFRDADIFENWIFSSLYIINKRHAPLVYKDLLFIALLHRFTRQNLINTVFVTGMYPFFFFKPTHWKSMPHELEQKAPSKTQWVGTRKESEQEDAKSKGAKKKKKITKKPSTLSIEVTQRQTSWWGLKSLDGQQKYVWGERKYTWRVFISA